MLRKAALRSFSRVGIPLIVVGGTAFVLENEQGKGRSEQRVRAASIASNRSVDPVRSLGGQIETTSCDWFRSGTPAHAKHVGGDSLQVYGHRDGDGAGAVGTIKQQRFGTGPDRSMHKVRLDSNYPDFRRHGPDSPLAKYLTPELYDKLKNKRTRNGVTLDSIIQAGVALPWGAHPPRGLGVYAGDAECYKVFRPLLQPILEDYHGMAELKKRMTQKARTSDGTTKVSAEADSRMHASHRQLDGKGRRKVRLQRQVTNLNPKHVTFRPIDPTGEYILYTRMRASRSVDGFAFTPAISRQRRRQVEQLLRDCVEQDFPGGQYHSIMDMTNAQHNDLIDRHILFKDPDAYANLAGLGRDWPDGRGLYCDRLESPNTVIWCNDNDHFRIISMQKGGSLQDVFANMTAVLHRLEKALAKRGQSFSTDPQLGFLNTSPTNCGTGLRASVYVKLVRLGQQPGFEELLHRMKLEASTRFNERDNRYTGIFDIANAERLGRSEVELINTMIDGIGRLIELEKQLERGEEVRLDEIEG
mmetsp:Transcript_23331/g.65078  ORF Transcript_23331/g.65078 Transcript_23331/m.65078 type:complete len:529 (-) Transcript_23331:226-1812(-)